MTNADSSDMPASRSKLRSVFAGSAAGSSKTSSFGSASFSPPDNASAGAFQTASLSSTALPPTKKNHFKLILGALMMAVTIVGGGAAYYLSLTNQDVRQQASEGNSPYPTTNPVPVDRERLAEQCVYGVTPEFTCYPSSFAAAEAAKTLTKDNTRGWVGNSQQTCIDPDGCQCADGGFTVAYGTCARGNSGFQSYREGSACTANYECSQGVCKSGICENNNLLNSQDNGNLSCTTPPTSCQYGVTGCKCNNAPPNEQQIITNAGGYDNTTYNTNPNTRRPGTEGEDCTSGLQCADGLSCSSSRTCVKNDDIEMLAYQCGNSTEAGEAACTYTCGCGPGAVRRGIGQLSGDLDAACANICNNVGQCVAQTSNCNTTGNTLQGDFCKTTANGTTVLQPNTNQHACGYVGATTCAGGSPQRFVGCGGNACGGGYTNCFEVCSNGVGTGQIYCACQEGWSCGQPGAKPGTNVANASPPPPSPTPQPSTPPPSTPPGTPPPETPPPTTPPVSYYCNSPCTTNSQCQSADSRFTCNAEQGNRCRLNTNPTAANCQPPTGPMCISISMTNITRPANTATQDPSRGDAVRFTCGEVAGAARYIFRVIEPDGLIATLSATGRTSNSYTISKSGKFAAQCQICTGAADSTCLPYENPGL